MAEFTTKFHGIVKDDCTGENLYFFEVFLPGETDIGSYFFYLTKSGRLARANKDFNVLGLDEHDLESKAFQKEMYKAGLAMLSELCWSQK